VVSSQSPMIHDIAIVHLTRYEQLEVGVKHTHRCD